MDMELKMNKHAMTNRYLFLLIHRSRLQNCLNNMTPDSCLSANVHQRLKGNVSSVKEAESMYYTPPTTNR